MKNPIDHRIVHIVYTAAQADMDTASLALQKTSNKGVEAFASKIIQDSIIVNVKALALLARAKLKPEESDTSDSLAGDAAEKRQALSKLNGPAFDKAFVENEIAYCLTINGALATVSSASTRNGELRSLLKTSQRLFDAHQKRAERLMAELR
jgi:putative membrane protein